MIRRDLPNSCGTTIAGFMRLILSDSIEIPGGGKKVFGHMPLALG